MGEIAPNSRWYVASRTHYRHTVCVAADLIVPPPAHTPGTVPRPLIAIARLLPQPVAFVMAGGGAHGSVQLGLLQAIAETDITPNFLVGTSAGALTSAVYAEDPRAACTRLSYVWSQLNLDVLLGDSWMSMIHAATRRKRSLADNVTEREAIEGILHARSFSELCLPVTAVATDLATGKATALHSGDLVSALLASSAIPGVLPPVRRDGRWYIDGLASANLPARIAVERGAGSIVVFDTGSRVTPPVSSAPTKVAGQVNRILNRNQRKAQLLFASSHVPTVVLPTPAGLGAALDFRDTQTAAAQAYELARTFFYDLSRAFSRRRRTVRSGLYARPDICKPDDELASWLVPVTSAEESR